MKKILLLFALVGMVAVGCTEGGVDDNIDNGGNNTEQPGDGNDDGEPSAKDNKIYYTTFDGKKLLPNNTEPATFGAILVSNTYEDGQGVLTFDDTITSIGDRAFYRCTSLTSITIPDGVTSIGESTFSRCSSLTSITIPDGVTSIGEDAFSDCTSLTSITIPDSVTSIGNYTFYSCTSLTSVTIGNGVTSIGRYAFFGCTSLTSVYITDIAAWCNISFGAYGSNPLHYAGNLYLNNELITDLIIPDSVTSIGEGAFYGCSSLTSVPIPDGVTSIGDYAFDGCSSLTSVNIPDGVTSIGGGAFSDCSSLISVTIPDSVTSIGYSAFSYCSSLTSVTIGNGVTSIGELAFSGCTSLKDVYCKPATPPAGDYCMFDDNASGRKIYVPRDSVEAYKSASYWDEYAEDIEGYDF